MNKKVPNTQEKKKHTLLNTHTLMFNRHRVYKNDTWNVSSYPLYIYTQEEIIFKNKYIYIYVYLTKKKHEFKNKQSFYKINI